LLLLGAATQGQEGASPRAVNVQYLEIVTPLVDETCDVLAEANNVVFGEPIPEFGNARTAQLSDGGLLGVRAPMRETEDPVVRPYLLVDDIEAAVKAAEAAGAEVAIPPLEIPGRGTFSIYILGGIQHGLWQL
jgi:predicted enzyme related to lactoylglutathione lyase